MLVSAVVVASMFVAMPEPPRVRKVPGEGGVAGASCYCPGDIDGSGAVDAADLSVLLGSWGGTGAANLDGVGVVNAADLSILLGAWGPCVAAPPNDTCANAQEIGVGLWNVCTIGASIDGPPLPASSGCNPGNYNQIDHDVWYQLTPPSDGVLTISTCDATWDTKIALYGTNISGVPACPSSGVTFANLVACSDDAAGCGVGSKLSANVSGGEPYKLRVGGYFGYSGLALLHVDFQPDGYDCVHAIDLGFPYSVTAIGSNDWTQMGVDMPNCSVGDGHSIWYRFSIPCAQPADVVVSTCHPGTDFDTIVTVWTQDLFGLCNAVEVACNDDSSTPGCAIGQANRKSRLAFQALPSGVYYIQVSGYQGAIGSIELSVDTGVCP